MCWITQALADLAYTEGQYLCKAELLLNAFSTELNTHTTSQAGFLKKYFITYTSFLSGKSHAAVMALYFFML